MAIETPQGTRSAVQFNASLACMLRQDVAGVRQVIAGGACRIDFFPKLPQLLRDNHLDIRPGDGMTRNQFKAALRALEHMIGRSP